MNPSSSDAPSENQIMNSSEKSDGIGGSISNASKKLAWNKPSNCVAEIVPVLGAVSWPALSESTRRSRKSSLSDLPKTDSDVSLQATSPPTIIHEPSSIANSNSTPNHAQNRQSPVKISVECQSYNSPSPSNGAISQPPSPSGSPAESNNGISRRHGNSTADSSPTENTHRDRPTGHQQQRNSYNRGSGGPHPHCDGPHHHGYGRGYRGRGNQYWNSNNTVGDRQYQVHQQRIRGPSLNLPQPFFHPGMSPVFRPVSMVPPWAVMFSPPPDPQAKIVAQIEYYFSFENLVKDTFLRENMDDQGWVPIKLIATFGKIMQLTNNIQYIVESVRNSNSDLVEVEGEKIRRRTDWQKWIIPKTMKL